MSETERPVPKPRRRVQISEDAVDNAKYENVQICPKRPDNEVNDNLSARPVPAPRPRNLQNNNERPTSRLSDAGAIRKAPNIPEKVTNRLNETHPPARARSNSTNSSNSTVSSTESGTAYKTSSPGELLKSLGATSKLLKDSISERLGKNLSKSKDAVESWTLEKKKTKAKKLKKIQQTFGTKNGRKLDLNDRPLTVGGEEQILRNITFQSPLNNRTGAIEDLTKDVYEVPKSNLPTYEDVTSSKNSFEFHRNTNLTQSLEVSRKAPKKAPRKSLQRYKSDSNIQDSDSDSSIEAAIPRGAESVYGKIKKIEEDPEAEVELRKKGDYENTVIIIKKPNIDSTSATIDSEADSDRIFSRQFSEISVPESTNSWTFSAQMDQGSSPEPVYANEDLDMDILRPLVNIQASTSGPHSTFRPSSEILKEFDPLQSKSSTRVSKSNDLALLEELFSSEIYGPNPNVSVIDTEDDEIPTPPERMDSLEPANPTELPSTSIQPPKRTKRKSKEPLIVHQNTSLPSNSNSLENLVDEAQIEPFLAQHDAIYPVLDMPLDPHKKASKPRSNWYLEDQFTKDCAIDPINTVKEKDEKVKKTVLPKSLGKSEDYLPSYNEAIAEKAEEKPPVSPTMEAPSTSGNSSNSSIRSKISNILRRRPSFKEEKGEVKVVEKIPRPMLSQRYITHRGRLVKLPSTSLEEILKEKAFRFGELQEKRFCTFLDPNRSNLKESFLLEHVTSIQAVNNHGAGDLHCFQINLSTGSPKNAKLSYVYGLHRQSERNIWLQKLATALSEAFPNNYSSDYSRVGWCYLKKNVSADWLPAWIMLCRRRLLLYCLDDLEILDLRKARCIGTKDADESIEQLCLDEKGPIMFIDCPPFPAYYLIMNFSRETKIWRNLILDKAHCNGLSLRQNQLTPNGVPVLICKMVDFLYIYGAFSPGIFRKPGISSKIDKLLSSLHSDAFSVTIIASEYSEHDVASALKKFLRELPEPILGKYSVSFMSVTGMQSKVEKISAYKELLTRLPTIEYQTTKKVLGLLNFLSLQQSVNKMSIDNLSIIFGPTLINTSDIDGATYPDKENVVVRDLIELYKNIFDLRPEDIAREQIIAATLKKYHAQAENLQSELKNSGDMRLWVVIDADPDSGEEKPNVSVVIRPLKTVLDICKELASHLKLAFHEVSLCEVILNGELTREMHWSEKVLDTILRWTSWPEADRKSNFLALRPTKLLLQVERALKNAPTVNPSMELKFGDKKNKTLKPYKLELVDGKIIAWKNDKQAALIQLKSCVCYIGCEKLRDCQAQLYTITLIDEFRKRSKTAPFCGYVISFSSFEQLITWYSSIIFHFHKDNVLPSPEIIY